MSESEARVDGLPQPVEHSHDLRAVLRIASFRKLWTALSLSSLGDWLGLLALTALASALSGASYAGQSFAVAGVFLLRLLPAVIFGPVAGVVADRLDRRRTMVVCDLLRFSLFLSIPIIGQLWWLYTATFLIEVVSLFWIPAKEATIPNLVPKERLEAANQLNLLATYGSAPVAAVVFTLLTLLAGVLGAGIPFFQTNPVDLALYFDAGTFLFSAFTIYRLTAIPSARVRPVGGGPPGLRTLIEGWRFVGQTPVIRGLIVGMIGAFAAGGAVAGLAKRYVTDLGGGNPAYGVVFGGVFLGLAVGMFLGPRFLAGFSRRRLFGLSIVIAGVTLSVIGLVPNMVIVVLLTLILGGFAGIAWVTGYTMLGLEVSDELRGRTFAFIWTLARAALALVLAAAPAFAGLIEGFSITPTEATEIHYTGAGVTLLLFGLLAFGVGLVSYRQMDDRTGVPLVADLVAALRGEPYVHPRKATTCFFIAFEGCEGSGKSTQTERLASWVRAKGHDVVVTREPGATELGTRLRHLLLDTQSRFAAHTEALLYAADRAEHVNTVIQPALDRGAVVITDRYVDSSVAYQGAGRSLPLPEVARLSRWATGGLKPDLTIILDVPPAVGLSRFDRPSDRLEQESLEFHERVRRGYLELASRDPERYLVVDATDPIEAVAAKIRQRLDRELPLSTVEREQIEAERQRRADEERRSEEERRRAEEERRALVDRCRTEAEERRRREAEVRAEEARRRRERERAERERAERERAERRAADERARAEAETRRLPPVSDSDTRRLPPVASADTDETRYLPRVVPFPEVSPDEPPPSLADELLGPWPEGGEGPEDQPGGGRQRGG